MNKKEDPQAAVTPYCRRPRPPTTSSSRRRETLVPRWFTPNLPLESTKWTGSKGIEQTSMEIKNESSAKRYLTRRNELKIANVS